MKSTGILKRTDELGRLLIPRELRNQLGIMERDPVEIFVENSYIVLRKYEDKCIFCGDTENLSEYQDKFICDKCLKNISNKTKCNNM